MSGRRNIERPRKTFEPQRLWNAHAEILRMATLGMKGTEIASALGITPAVVSYTLNSHLGQERLGFLQAARDAETMDVVEKMKTLIPDAVAVYERILKEEQASLALKMKAADEVLSRAGHPIPKHIVGDIRHHGLTPEELEVLKKRGDALKAKIIDVEYQLVEKT